MWWYQIPLQGFFCDHKMCLGEKTKTPKQRTKIVKINYSSEQEMKKSVYYEECIDGFWFRGDLYFDSVEDLDYGVKSARYTGILYEGE